MNAKACQMDRYIQAELTAETLKAARLPKVKGRASPRVTRGFVAGLLLLTAGGVWMLTPVGFGLPLYALLPIGAMLIGGLFMFRPLNHHTGTSRRAFQHDRCDH